ncbi:Vacuolar protein sorting-associated protein 54 [Bienertia sinuspersici]
MQYAVVRTTANPSKQFRGIEGWPSLYKPKVDGSIKQYSATRMKLSNGPDSIEVGWMAGDKGCMDTQCPGFVHVAKDVPLGDVPERYSQIDGEQYTWKLFIDKHEDTGDWWVSIDEDKYGIGYWPKSLFTGLSDVANQAEWGGEVGVHSGQKSYPFPEMGSGRRAIYNTKRSAFFQHITVANEAHVSVNPEDTEKFYNWEPLYLSLDEGYQGDYWGRLIFFGGPTFK